MWDLDRFGLTGFDYNELCIKDKITFWIINSLKLVVIIFIIILLTTL